MTKRCRNRVRSRGKLVLNSYNRMVQHFAYVQCSEHWKDWAFRTISLRQAEILVIDGEAERVTRLVDGEVQVVGYRALNPTRWERPSPTTLTLSTMIAVGKRAQHCLLKRHEEREIMRFIVWPLIGDTKATCVRPPMTTMERRCAESVLQTGRLAA
jgi:hypothetical protein